MKLAKKIILKKIYFIIDYFRLMNISFLFLAKKIYK